MPSQEIARQRYNALNQKNLSPNETRAIEAMYDNLAKQEEARFVGMCQQDRAALDAQLAEHEAKAKETLMALREKVQAAQQRRLSAKEIAKVRDELQRFIGAYEGDGERQVGLVNTLETGYERISAIEEDPGKYADDFYRRWPSLAENRFRDIGR